MKRKEMNKKQVTCRYCGATITLNGRGKAPTDSTGRKHGCTPRQRRFRSQFVGFTNLSERSTSVSTATSSSSSSS